MDLLEQAATPSVIQLITNPQEIPEGFCRCGCGKPTRLAKYNSKQYGWIKGKPVNYVHGHQGNWTGPDYEVRDCGYLSPCWVWLKSFTDYGYGRVWNPQTRRHDRAHRVYYERLKGSIPDGLKIDHLCRNAPCVNPEHLQPVPNKINVRRGARAFLTKYDVINMISMRKSGMEYKEIASHFGIAVEYSQSICRGARWKGVVSDEDLIKPKKRLTVEVVREVKRLKALGLLNKEIVSRSGVALFNVYAIVTGRNWAHVKL